MDSTMVAVTPEEYDPDFVEAWAAQEDAGYIYSESNIAKVYMGWQLARQDHPEAKMLKVINEALAFYDALGLPHAPGEADILDKLDRARRNPLARHQSVRTGAGEALRAILRDLLPYAEAATASCASNDDYMILCDLIDKARAALSQSTAGEDGT